VAEAQPPSSETLAIDEALLRLSRTIAGFTSLNELLRQLPASLHEAVPFDHLGLVLHDADRDVLRIALVHPDVPLPMRETPVDFGPAGVILRSQQTMVIRLDTNEPLTGMMPTLRDLGFRILCGVPLTTPRARLGVLVFASCNDASYGASAVILMEQITAQVALAVEHAVQLERLEALGASLAAERDRVQFLLRLNNAITSELDLEQLLKMVSKLLGETITHHFASLTLWNADRQQFHRHALLFPTGKGVIKPDVPVPPSSPAILAFNAGQTMVFRQEDVERLGGDGARVMREEGLTVACCIPIVTARGKYGTLNIASPNPDAFPPDEVALLEQVSRQLAIAIENATVVHRANNYRRQLGDHRDRLQLLLDVNNLLVSELDYPSVLAKISQALRDVIQHDYASIALYDAESGQMQLHALTFTDERGVQPADRSLPLDSSPAGITYQRGVVSMFGEAELASFGPTGAPTLIAEGIKSICCVPLVTRRSKLGVISVASRSAGAFSADDGALLGQLSSQIAIAVENARAYGEIAVIKEQLAGEKDYLLDEVRLAHDFREIIGQSAALKRVLQTIATVAPTDSTVLLLGETGTGKELLARALHNLSRRRDRTFVRLNGAALPAGLIESELFGYDKGAFTGAAMSKVGRLELANRGTLFLDEVGDLPLDVQPKLLRALQEREFERLGSTRTLRVDVRLIAATNRDLEAMVSSGQFRNDLFYRLNVFPILVPALRERREDIPALVSHFVAKFSREMNRRITTIPDETIAALVRWHWPGNIRELENVIERAVILSSGPVLQVPPTAIHPRQAARVAVRDATPARLTDAERDAILRALRESNGIVAGPHGAAARLGVKRTTLQSKMRKLGITRPGY
jgi:formate hydrogenlyase transcriptional activator